MSVNTIRDVIVTGIGMELPGAMATAIADIRPGQLRPEVFDPKARVGRKGIRYKDHATLLAMSAGCEALRDAGLPEDPEAQVDSPNFGVVVSSNLGNLDTVVNVVRTIRSEHVNAASAMDLPNASSNVVASSLAIRHGLQGPNLMLCNGATSGLDALHLAANCIRVGRANRMLVVGVEVDNDVVRMLNPSESRWFNGAVAVIIESDDAARGRGAKQYGRLGDYQFAAGQSVIPPSWADNLTSLVGESYGAEGILRLVCALQEEVPRPHTVLSCGRKFGDDVVAMLEVEPYA